ncbi:MAG: hypothetical protein IPK16_26395 [Anaerolineales bacterium]|nr:hypothetical protein [Anaerolineales bacterium]
MMMANSAAVSGTSARIKGIRQLFTGAKSRHDPVETREAALLARDVLDLSLPHIFAQPILAQALFHRITLGRDAPYRQEKAEDGKTDESGN